MLSAAARRRLVIRSLTRRETADRLGVCVDTIDNWRREGVLASVKVGGVVRIPIAQPDPAIADLLGGGEF